MRAAFAALSILLLAGCAAEAPPKKAPAPAVRIDEDPYKSTYVRYPGAPTVIRHATLFDGDGKRIDDATIVSRSTEPASS